MTAAAQTAELILIAFVFLCLIVAAVEELVKDRRHTQAPHHPLGQMRLGSHTLYDQDEDRAA